MSYIVILMSLKGLGAFSAGKYSYFSAPTKTGFHALSGKIFLPIYTALPIIYTVDSLNLQLST
jgi:hypothetical protein